MVKWTAHAITQLRHIHDYIAQDSLLYAKRVPDDLYKLTRGFCGTDGGHRFKFRCGDSFAHIRSGGHPAQKRITPVLNGFRFGCAISQTAGQIGQRD
jgi:hypothetical protein